MPGHAAARSRPPSPPPNGAGRARRRPRWRHGPRPARRRVASSACRCGPSGSTPAALREAGPATIRMPAIAHLSGQHFVVVEGLVRTLRGHRVQFVDPVVGRRQLPVEQFAEISSGVFLTPQSPRASREPAGRHTVRHRAPQPSRRRVAATSGIGDRQPATSRQPVRPMGRARAAAGPNPRGPGGDPGRLRGHRAARPRHTTGHRNGRRPACRRTQRGPAAARGSGGARRDNRPGGDAARECSGVRAAPNGNAARRHTPCDSLLRAPHRFVASREGGDLIARVASADIVRDTLTGPLVQTIVDGVLVTSYLAVVTALDPGLGLLATALATVQLGFAVLGVAAHPVAASRGGHRRGARGSHGSPRRSTASTPCAPPGRHTCSPPAGSTAYERQLDAVTARLRAVGAHRRRAHGSPAQLSRPAVARRGRAGRRVAGPSHRDRCHRRRGARPDRHAGDVTADPAGAGPAARPHRRRGPRARRAAPRTAGRRPVAGRR